MRLVPPQRAAIVVLAVATLPIAWWIVVRVDPSSSDPMAEIRAVAKAAIWMRDYYPPELVRACARLWFAALLVLVGYQWAAQLVRRLWGWVVTGS